MYPLNTFRMHILGHWKSHGALWQHWLTEMIPTWWRKSKKRQCTAKCVLFILLSSLSSPVSCSWDSTTTYEGPHSTCPGKGVCKKYKLYSTTVHIRPKFPQLTKVQEMLSRRLWKITSLGLTQKYFIQRAGWHGDGSIFFGRVNIKP